MPYSCADFASNLVNHLFDNALIPATVASSTDLEYQAAEAMAAITDLAERATAAQRQARSVQFMTELLDAHETLTEIGEQQGVRTLADCMYMLSAVQKGTQIEVHHPTESEILDIIQSLPSASLWMTYVHEVTE